MEPELALLLTLLASLLRGSLCLLPIDTQTQRYQTYKLATNLSITQAIFAILQALKPPHHKLTTSELPWKQRHLLSIIFAHWLVGLAPQIIERGTCLFNPESAIAEYWLQGDVLWTLTSVAYAYGSTALLINSAIYIVEAVQSRWRYVAMGVYVYLQEFTRLLATLSGLLLTSIDEDKLFRFYAGISSTFLLLGLAVLHVTQSRVAEAETDNISPHTFLRERQGCDCMYPSPDVPRLRYGSQGSLTSLTSAGKFLQEPLLPSPSALSRNEGLTTPESYRADFGMSSRETEIKRYFSNSRRELLLGLYLPWTLFSFVVSAFGTFSFLIQPPLLGWEGRSGKFACFLVAQTADAVSCVIATGLLAILVPKLALLYEAVAACFVWFGLGVSLYSVASTEGPQQSIEAYPLTCLFYDSVFRVFCSGQGVALTLIVVEAVHTRVRIRVYATALFANLIGEALGLMSASTFFDSAPPGLKLLTSSLVFIIMINTLRGCTPSLPKAHATLCDIDFRTKQRFDSAASDQDEMEENGGERSVHTRRPSLRSTRSRVSTSRLERKPIANFVG